MSTRACLLHLSSILPAIQLTSCGGGNPGKRVNECVVCALKAHKDVGDDDFWPVHLFVTNFVVCLLLTKGGGCKEVEARLEGTSRQDGN
uniref:Secreted protein n=1 Tax=Panagrellus redivivus TaxID=6233 RepID=A0A7E4ZVU4_PANRE